MKNPKESLIHLFTASYSDSNSFAGSADHINSPNSSRGKNWGKRSMTGRGRGRGHGHVRASAIGRGRGKANGREIKIVGSIINPTYVDRLQDELNDPSTPSPPTRPSPNSSRVLHSSTYSTGRRGSGSSTPRGLFMRKKSTQPSQSLNPKGGLGFQPASSSNLVPEFLSTSSKLSQSFNRKKTDPKLWVPVKFVKATALSDKSLLDNSQEEKENTAPTAVAESTPPHESTSLEHVTQTKSTSHPITGKVSALNPDQPLNPFTNNDQKQIENFTEASIEHWQSQFPGIFNITSSINAFHNHAPELHCSQLSTPLELRQNLRQSKDRPLTDFSTDLKNEPASDFTAQSTSTGLPSHSGHKFPDTLSILTVDPQNKLLSPATSPPTNQGSSSNADLTDSYRVSHQSKTRVATLSNDEYKLLSREEPRDLHLKPLSTETFTSGRDNSQVMLIPKPDIPAPKSCDSPGQVPEAATPSLSSPPLFFMDDAGDPRNLPSFSPTHPPALGQVVSQTSDDGDKKISFQLSQRSPAHSKTHELHLFRTITDEANIQSQLPYKQPSVSNLQPSKHATFKTRKRFNRTQKRKERRNLIRQEDKSCSHRPDSISGSDIDLGDEIDQKSNAASTLTKVEPVAISRKAQKRALKEKEEKELMEDYLKHTMMSEAEGSDDLTRDLSNNDQSLAEKMENDNFLMTFMRGMDPQESYHVTIDQLDRHGQEEEDNEFLEAGGYRSESSTSSLQNGLEALGLEVSKFDSKIPESEPSEDSCTSDLICSELLEVPTAHGADDDSDIGLTPISKRQDRSFQKLRKGIQSTGKPEAKGRDKVDIKLKKKIQSLEMALAYIDECSGSEPQSEVSEEELPTLTNDKPVHKKNRKCKYKKSVFSDKDNDLELIEFIDQLQSQWKKDRSRKAERKQARAEARLLNEPKTEKQRKKFNKNIKKGNKQEPDLISLDKIIRDFITNRPDQDSLNLPSLTKKTRARVHELATVYNMKSHSIGSGLTRYPILYRTYRTDTNLVDKRKRQRILYGTGQFNENEQDKMNTNCGKFSKDGYAKGRLLKKNKEGQIVGEGVGHIGEDNIGFKLLTKMGWSMGQTMGNPDGSASALQVPLLAVMKSTKAGLGSSSHLLR